MVVLELSIIVEKRKIYAKSGCLRSSIIIVQLVKPKVKIDIFIQMVSQMK